MNSFGTFKLDPEHTRSLARDLEEASQFHRPVHSPLPTDGTVAGFIEALESAMENAALRSERIHADTAHIARAGFAMANAAEATDSAAGASFNRFRVS